MDPVESRKRGRPKKSFHQLSSVMKQRKVREIRRELSHEELASATERSFKAKGFLDASKLINSLIENPKMATDYLQCYGKQKSVKRYTADEALALFTDMRLTKRKYVLMHKGSKERKCSICPPYHQLSTAKSDCYPPKENIQISELGFQIDLQAIVDLTAIRLVKTLKISPQRNLKLQMISKWGFDGASSQSQYKLKFQNADSDDSSIFMTSIVPILLREKNKPEIIYWKNEKPSSTTLCRPVRLAFQRESEAYTLKVKGEIDEEIRHLRSTIVIGEDFSVEIDHEVICTMIDGKICSYLTDTSSQSCFVCNATPSQMNKLNLIYRRPKNTNFYQYGLSTLHAWIRFLGCVLNVSYNMPFKQWSTRRSEHKKLREERKRQIQNEFREKTGLRVDFVKQGVGTTNDGNTARRFFRNYQLSAQITGFDVNLLKRFAVILQVISSGLKINIEHFENYTRETARIFVQLYGWYNMPATVHKILIHGSDIIEYAIVPIGQLSEEVQESRHKEVRRYRECNTRKMTRLNTNEDLLHSLLISSDPLISSYRQIPILQKLELFPEANDLLVDFHSDEMDSGE